MILVTGASGTVGTETVKALKAKSVPFKVAVRDLAKATALGAEGVKFDYEDKGTWEAALKGVDTLFLLTPPAQPAELQQGLDLVAAAKKAGVQKIVKLSAMGVENAPDSPHRQTELAIEASGLKWAHLRPTFFHQNFSEGWVAAIKGYKALTISAADGKTGFIDARDIGKAAAVLLTDSKFDGKGWALTGPESLDHSQVAAKLSEAVGYTVTYTALSDEAFRAAMKSWGMSDYMVELYSNLYKMVSAGWTANLSPDLETLTGSKGIPFGQFAADYAAVWK